MAGRALRRLSPRVVRSATRAVDRFTQRNILRKRDSSLTPDGHVDVIVNFPDRIVNLYQIRQWYGPLEWLAQHYSVAVMCYNPITAKVIRNETDLRVLLTPSFSDITAIETIIKPDVVLYPNQNYLNYQILGYPDAVHGFICHGESDKIYMASNWLKGFDYFLIAGEASAQRLRKHLLNYDVESRTLRIGRPQVDIHPTPQMNAAPDRITVLYAPTWEGGRTSMSYGSVLSHGESIVDALLANPKYRIIYRPHPRTGIRSHAEREANWLIKERLQQVIESDPTCGHMIDETPFGWQLDLADVMVTDISAVAYDWLTTAKPLIMTRPSEPAVPVTTEGLVGAMDLLSADKAGTIGAIIDAELTDDSKHARREELATFYYGDRAPGHSLERFRVAVQTMVDEARRWKAEKNGAAPREIFQRATAGSMARNFVHGMALQLTRGTRRAEGTRAVDRTLAERSATLVLSVMGGTNASSYAARWLPFLTELDRTTDWSVAIACGDLTTYRSFQSQTGLRVFYAGNTLRAELVMDALDPLVTLHATQVQTTLRETTYRNTTHAYLGDPDDDLWVNNRLRDFDAVIAPRREQLDLLEQVVRPMPSEVRVFTLESRDSCGEAEGLRQVLEELRHQTIEERAKRAQRNASATDAPRGQS